MLTRAILSRSTQNTPEAYLVELIAMKLLFHCKQLMSNNTLVFHYELCKIVLTVELPI